MSLLTSCKLVYNEGFEMYMKSANFCFMEARALSSFVDEHKGLIQHVRSVIIDQTDFSGPLELSKMLRLLNRLPSPSRICIYLDMDVLRRWSDLDFELLALKEVLLQPSLFRNIKPETLFILDPFLEARYAKGLRTEVVRCSGEVGFLSAMILLRLELGDRFVFDGLTDQIRDNIRFERRDITSDRRMGLARDTVTRAYFMALGSSSPTGEEFEFRSLFALRRSIWKARDELEKRFCRTHGVMLCPCRSM
jgi:hypothetical protein